MSPLPVGDTLKVSPSTHRVGVQRSAMALPTNSSQMKNTASWLAQ
jgi:hypothetical protein